MSGLGYKTRVPNVIDYSVYFYTLIALTKKQILGFYFVPQKIKLALPWAIELRSESATFLITTKGNRFGFQDTSALGG